MASLPLPLPSGARSLGVALSALFLGAQLFAQEIIAKTDKPSGLYALGETVHWTLSVKGDAKALSDATYEVKPGGLGGSPIAVSLASGETAVTAKLDQPGWLLLKVSAKKADGKTVEAQGGALIAPEALKPATPEPADFDAFWAAKLAELAAVPANPVLSQGVSGKDNVEYYYLTMQNIRGTRIEGQLAKPKGEGKFPACLIVQWAGVYPLKKEWAVDRAAQGYLTLNILAHDLPIANPSDFYDGQKNGPLKDYGSLGNENRETSYFLRMYLSCYRAAEYLASRPDWDGRVMVVTGASQGGLQSLMIAGLHPKISAVVVDVPAGCDQGGPLVGRRAGWPNWIEYRNNSDLEKVKTASAYYDITHFASRIKCPVLVSTGLIDTTCPPVGVYATYNQLKGPKEIVVMPEADHQNRHQAFDARREVWFASLKDGKIPAAR